jgi:hypothetical protein
MQKQEQKLLADLVSKYLISGGNLTSEHLIAAIKYLSVTKPNRKA